jgi:DNA-binding Lrp family transcriptional regulator
MDDTVKHMIEITQISHCYERLPQEKWPYNIYTMIHCETYEECERIIKELASIHRIERYEVLYSVRELKKSSMKFFME